MIGVNAAGTADLGNTGYGVEVQLGVENVVGGSRDSNLGNVISGNLSGGVYVVGNSENLAEGTKIQGNLIGTDKANSVTIGNGRVGVAVNGAKGVLIGGTSDAFRNVIAGTKGNGLQEIWRGHGIALYGYADGTLIQGNWIGIGGTGDKAGARPLGNQGGGIYVQLRAKNTTIGGTAANARNYIAANGSANDPLFGYGVEIHGTNTTVDFNWIGYFVTGTQAKNELGSFLDDGTNTTWGANNKSL